MLFFVKSMISPKNVNICITNCATLSNVNSANLWDADHKGFTAKRSQYRNRQNQCVLWSVNLTSHVAQAPCAVQRDALSIQVSNLSPGMSTYHRIITNNSYAHNEHRDNPRKGKEDSMMSIINYDRCWHLISSVNVLAALAWLKQTWQATIWCST